MENLAIADLQHVVLEESYVLGVAAAPGKVEFRLEAVLTPEHPEYTPPTRDERECFREGRLVFESVAAIHWVGQGAPPATDASGEIDYGHIDRFERSPDGSFVLEGDWGQMTLQAGPPRLVLSQPA